MPPIAASSQSRNKLRAFQFDQENAPPANGKGHDEVVRAGGEATDPAKAKGSQVPQEVAPAQHLSQKAGQKDSKECPQTPVGRLPLAELIASGEDFNQTLNLTPVERVLWNNSARNSEQGSSQETPALAKSRKRAYSSSPVSSSQKKYKTSDHFAAGEKSVDVQHLQRALKTPQGDPASDLWKKYSLNAYSNEKLSPTGAFGQPSSQLMNSSSPQTPTDRLLGREFAGLRRSFSCGTEWPTSAAKRRKLQHAGGGQESQLALGTTEEGLQKSERSKSRLSLLVAKISGDLARPTSDKSDDLPTSSCKSPCRDEGEIPIDQPQSPVVRTGREEDERGQDESPASDRTTIACKDLAENHLPDGTPLQEPREAKKIDDLSDDFGDDDLDLEMFDAVDAEVEAQESEPYVPYAHPGIKNSKDGSRNTGRPPTKETKDTRMITNDRDKTVLRDLSGKLQEIPRLGQAKAATMTVRPDVDEFDEDAIDVSVEDLEDAFAMYDQQADLCPEQNATLGRNDAPEASQKQSTVYGSSPEDPQMVSMVKRPDPGNLAALSEDEFGGDLEFEEIVAECDRATQGHPSTSQLHASVCLGHFGSST